MRFAVIFSLLFIFACSDDSVPYEREDFCDQLILHVCLEPPEGCGAEGGRSHCSSLVFERCMKEEDPVPADDGDVCLDDAATQVCSGAFEYARVPSSCVDLIGPWSPY